MVFNLDEKEMKDYISMVEQVEKEIEEERGETEEKETEEEDMAWLMAFIKKLMKKTGMKNLREASMYPATKAGYRAWLEKYKGTYEEFLTLRNFAVKIYGRWKSFL